MLDLIENKRIVLLSRFIVGFIFIYASIEKIIDPESFAQSIDNYKLTPYFLINITAIILPWIELCAGILLIFGFWTKENSLLLGGLLLFFIIIISISMARGLDFDCGCYGSGKSNRIGFSKIIENATLAILCLHIFIFNKSE